MLRKRAGNFGFQLALDVDGCELSEVNRDRSKEKGLTLGATEEMVSDSDWTAVGIQDVDDAFLTSGLYGLGSLLKDLALAQVDVSDLLSNN